MMHFEQQQQQVFRSSQQMAAAPGQRTSAAAPDDVTEADDNLDQLTSQYAAQAEAEARAAAVKHAASKQPSQKGMQQLRSDGLATALLQDNKGFQMLQRMGWAEGQGLGAAGTGRAAPVALELKTKRTGLGIDEGRKQRQAHAQQQLLDRAAKRVKFQQEDRATFRETSARRFGDAAAEKHVMAARKTIETLDERGGILRHQLWLPLPLPLAAEYEEAAGSSEPETEPNPWDLLTAQQRLADVLGYLREHHFYCLFCGCQFNDAAEMAEACPGPAEDDH